jgi:hypothetical protein
VGDLRMSERDDRWVERGVNTSGYPWVTKEEITQDGRIYAVPREINTGKIGECDVGHNRAQMSHVDIV